MTGTVLVQDIKASPAVGVVNMRLAHLLSDVILCPPRKASRVINTDKISLKIPNRECCGQKWLYQLRIVR